MADKTTRIKDAQKYLAKGQIDKAIAEWEKIVQEYPDGHNFNSIGDLYLKKGDNKNAIETFHKAANFFRREGFSLKALALFKKVLTINPTDSAALYALGELSEEKELITDAIKYYLATADSLSKEGKKDKVFDIYEKILSLSPSNVPLRIKVAETLLKQGLISDAAKEYLFIAGLYGNKGDIQKSKEYYLKTIDVQPLNKDAVIGLSYLYEKAGETKNAMELMKEATVLFNDHVDILIRAAELSLSGNNIKNAKSCISKINELEPKNTKARRLLGEIYLKEGQKEKAWAEYLVVLDNIILEEKYNDAIKILESFREIDPIDTGRRLISIYKHLGEIPHIAEELTSLGDLYNERGIHEEALTCYNEAFEIEPDNDYLHQRIAELKGGPEEKVPEFPEFTEPAGAETPVELEGIHEEKVPEFTEITEPAVFETAEPGEIDQIETHKRLVSLYKQLGKKPRVAEELTSLGDVYYDRQMHDEALACYNEAFEIEPDNDYLHQRIAELKEMHEEKVPEFTGFTEPAGEEKPAELKEMHEELVPEFTGFTEPAGEEKPAELRGMHEGLVPEYTEITEPAGAEKPAGKEVSAHISKKTEKSVEEIFSEADIFARYGLLSEAQKLLEGLKLKIPKNMDLHMRLKSLYSDIGDKEAAVTECLILSELYKRDGDIKNSDRLLREGFGISPSDPRLANRGLDDLHEVAPSASESIEKFMRPQAEEEISIGDHEEELAEADFYARQGLASEALKILLKLQELFPGNTDIAERLESLGGGAGISDLTEMPETIETHELSSFELPEEESPDVAERPESPGEEAEIADITEMPEKHEMSFEPPQEEPPEAPLTGETPLGKEASEEKPEVKEQLKSLAEELEKAKYEAGATPWGEAPEEKIEKKEQVSAPEEEPEITEYEDLMFSEDELTEAQEMPEPTLDNDVLEIFQEFKKGLETQLEDEDSETHYNLGIAYKEMGLVDDAIKEFQVSRNDKKSFLQSSSMLAICYMEKGLYSLAIDILDKTLVSIEVPNESYWSIKYDLAEAHEKNNDLKKALELYTEVYGWNASFRNVSEKLSSFKAQPAKSADKEKPKGRKDRVSYL